MKFNLNLATQPYEDIRRFYMFWVSLLLAVAVLTGGLVYGAVAGWRNAHATALKVAAERANLDKLKQQEQADIAILNKPENLDVKDRSQVLNNLIRQKEFSWTLIFADLEELMPTRLHVLAIRPRLNANNDIEIQMTVAGDSRDKAIELVQNMEKSRDFRHAQVTSEVNSPKDQAQGGQFGDSVRFEITAQYVPLPAPVAPPAQPPAAQPRSGE